MIIDREQLIKFIENANSRIRILGAVCFDLPYERFLDDWLSRIDQGVLSVEIICESEPSLGYSSLISSNKKVSGETRSYDIGTFLTRKQAPKKKVRDFLVANNCKHIEPEDDSLKEFLRGFPAEKKESILAKRRAGKFDMAPFRQMFSLRTCYLNLPTPVINIDDNYYVAQALTRFCTHDKFEQITEEHVWYDEYQKYFQVYLDNPIGAKKYSSEVTAKDNKTEVIIMYNDQRHVLGQLPRDSFLGSTKVKVVIWGIIFSRDGKLLIHKRDENAKDNQDLWDKSVGGHVDLEKDVVDTVKAASREMLEELYKVEQAEQGGHSKRENMEVNEDKPIFLGEWRPEMRFTFPFSEISSKEDETYFFRMNYRFSTEVIDSPRLMPSGTEKPVKVFADVYVFVMPSNFSTINLQNSEYILLETHELNDAHQEGEISFNGEVVPFNSTPDLKKILTGALWTELNSFVDYLKGN